ncbi:TasA family protein [Arthrobacter bambusae]|jgi:predicted ribosomally synthesized peptide with SipW-like signal peptide|uniref:Ribosomally synthesized peptide with SipW-like signal peptide n=1 Tax=Arthrobacter bambusae TaxID=1338426 RepID=A0AAW8DB46_9MICC|nr:TasA family protein [Arthrobacter bambusae]MDP9903703.1 putative ribosomally synthesized peptide with SipW-like signal peptide [Arthrobacter bambusae]MDQ0128302.1 putative ribosomally synthesized peptide with SipW-like signal peptide [Arthrobacter bambusae]MDQ0179644.1 putative ribosomally synthesized peptide with SipW-like signal peptide [Arthrobacter bambusae]
MGLNLKTTTGKVIASLALVGTAAGVAGLGTYGAFTSSTSASNTVASGIVNIALGATGTTNRLSVAASGLVPGDTVQRVATLANATGNQNLSAITLTTAASPTSLLDTNTTMGLQVTVDNCSTAWTEAGTAPAYTYTCSGTTTSVLASRPVIGANLTLANLTSVTAGHTDNLRVTLTLPSTADNTLQNQSSTIAFSFTGTQRTATNQ